MKTTSCTVDRAGGLIDERVRESLNYATRAMWRTVTIPETVRNIVYRLTRSEPRNKRGHLMGSYPDVAFAFAAKEAPFSDVTAPMDELRLQLKQRFYRRNLPTLTEAEHKQADAACRIQVAEIMRDARALREAERLERDCAELVIEVLDAESA